MEDAIDHLMSTALEILPTPAAIVDSDFRIIAVNQRFLAAVRITDPSTMNGKRVGDVSGCINALEAPAGCGTSPKCPGCFIIRTLMRSREGAPIPTEEGRFIIDGEETAAESSAFPCVVQGTLMHLLQIRDISEQKRLQEQHERALAARHQSARLSALGRLIGGIAHEVNNPLTILLGNANIIKDSNELGPQNQHRIERVITSANRISSIIADLRIFTDRGTAWSERFNLQATLSRALAIIHHELNSHDVAIHFVEPPTPIEIQGEPAALQHAILQVLLNAGDTVVACHPSGLGKIEVTLENPGNRQAIIHIQDNGSGITPENLEHVFEPFFTTHAPNEGMGLGLTITHEIVKAHAGSINIASKIDRGTLVTITLPTL